MSVIQGEFPVGPGVDLGADAEVVPIRATPRLNNKGLPVTADRGIIGSAARTLALLTYDECMRDAAAASDAGHPLEAVRLYRAAMLKNGACPHAPINCGEILHRTGDIGMALGMYRRSIRLQDSVIARFNVGVALEDLGDEVGAIVSYRRAIRIDASYADAHHNLARLLEKRGHESDAEDHMKIYTSLQKSKKNT